MSIPIPKGKPNAAILGVVNAARKQWAIDHPAVCFPLFFVLAVRSYFDQTIAPNGNNLNAYDDAFFIVSPLGFTAWNGNTDPTRYGWNANAGKYMARLKVGCYKFIHRIHRSSYWAFGQGDNEVVVERIKSDGSIAMSESGCFGIDLHKGGVNGTSSEGCNTVPVEQWQEFHDTLLNVMNQLNTHTFDFILIDGPIN